MLLPCPISPLSTTIPIPNPISLLLIENNPTESQMCSSSSSSLLCFPAHNPSLFLRHRAAASFLVNPRPTIIKPNRRLHASLTESNAELSWSSPDQIANHEYGGWAIVDSPVHKKKTGLPPFLIGGIGTSLVVLLATITHFSISRRGCRFQFGSPLRALHGILNPSGTKRDRSELTSSAVSDETTAVPDGSLEDIPHSTGDTASSGTMEKLERIIIPAAVDSTQQEALSVLKKLKIIEDDVKADELCTRREYARWLLRVNSLLERNPKHRVIPEISLSGSTDTAFDDINVEDPDFGSIQALAESGVTPSKLSPKNSSDDGSEHRETYFYPERYNSKTTYNVFKFPFHLMKHEWCSRFISRQDLIDWKAQLDYEFTPGIIEQISRAKLGFLDMREISSDASTELFMDMLAGDSSMLRKVFGQSRRFQPNKPSTKAQAAVALTTGRMTEAIYNELARLEAENSARQAEMEDIRSELLDRGDIQRFWDEKLIEAKTQGFQVEKVYLANARDLEREKIDQEKLFSEFLKEKAAMDCQRQLVLSLKEEVAEMSEKLASERALYITEQHDLHNMLSDLQITQEGLLDTKSILEAEKEALRILRSWVEDEARKSQARAKVLEEVGRRWKWDNQA